MGLVCVLVCQKVCIGLRNGLFRQAERTVSEGETDCFVLQHGLNDEPEATVSLHTIILFVQVGPWLSALKALSFQPDGAVLAKPVRKFLQLRFDVPPSILVACQFPFHVKGICQLLVVCVTNGHFLLFKVTRFLAETQ